MPFFAINPLFIILFITVSLKAAPEKKIIACHDEKLATYVEVPDKSNGVFVLFVPGKGYMDGFGRSSAKGLGVFSGWQKEFVKSGFSTVQFDKPGTGSSSGRLNQREEEAFFCVYKSLFELSTIYRNKLILFTYAGGIDYIRFSLKAMDTKKPRDTVLSVIQLAGLTHVDFEHAGQVAPYFSLLGDTSRISDQMEKVLLHKKLAGDSTSEVHVAQGVHSNLCEQKVTECKLKQELFDVTFEWIKKHTESRYVWEDKPTPDSKTPKSLSTSDNPHKKMSTRKVTFGKIDRSIRVKNSQEDSTMQSGDTTSVPQKNP